MISVRNHLLRLSGSRNLLWIVFCTLLTVSACAPKKKVVLKSPEYSGTDVKGKTDIENEKEEEEEVTEEDFFANNIALLLPFQLQHVSPENISEGDIKRSAIALDFYQGVQIGLEELSSKGERIALNVLDSRDDEWQNRTLAQSEEVKDASIVLGPVFPKEIKAFGSQHKGKNILQVNPLAAAMPSEFMLPNLVSLTPSIQSHMKSLAKEIVNDYRDGDVVILLNLQEANSRQFLTGMESELKSLNPSIKTASVSKATDIDEHLSTGSTNRVVCGTTNRFELSLLINYLDGQYNENDLKIKLYGHPLWDRLDFSTYPYFSDYTPTITSDNGLKPSSSATRRFNTSYKENFGVEPSEHSYKGYDAAIYFGKLIEQHGNNINDQLEKTPFHGLYSSYEFSFNPSWGYANEALSIRVYNNGSFQLK